MPRAKSSNPSPQPKKDSGLNGALPSAWDAGWQFYTDLTQAQIAAFQAMPEWQSFVASFNSWQQSPVSSPAPSLTVAMIRQLGKL